MFNFNNVLKIDEFEKYPIGIENYNEHKGCQRNLVGLFLRKKKNNYIGTDS